MSKIYKIKVYCTKCDQLLYLYQKDKKGHLVKCYKDRILEDFTNGDLKCPKCHENFAREATYHCRAANKIIQGKVFTKGHCKEDY